MVEGRYKTLQRRCLDLSVFASQTRYRPSPLEGEGLGEGGRCQSSYLQLLGELFVLFLDSIVAKVGMFGHID